MYSSEDLERFYFQYQAEALPHEESVLSPLYAKALNYLKRFWDGMFAFLSNGELPIDNNLTEQTIRKLTPNVTTRSIMAAISVLRWRRPTIA